jgi:ribosomal protein L12E/L44/L45/RPP1/RPP2
MVRVLLGDGWTLQIDPLLRRIAFAPASVASAPTASAAAADTLAASTQQVQP